MAADIRIEGGDRLGRLSQELKIIGDKDFQNAMRKRLRQAAKPIAADVKAEAAKHSRSIPSSIVLEMKYGQRVAGAYIKAKKSRMDARKQELPGLLEYGSKGSGGRFIRHPVFAARGTSSRLTGRRRTYSNLDRSRQGRQVVWVNQPTHPFLAPTATKHIEQVRQEMKKVMDDVEAVLRGA